MWKTRRRDRPPLYPRLEEALSKRVEGLLVKNYQDKGTTTRFDIKSLQW